MRNLISADDCTIDTRNRMPKICLQEILQIIPLGIYPSEARLEYLLDHIEGTP